MIATTRSAGGSSLAGVHVAAIEPRGGNISGLMVALLVAAGLGVTGSGIAQPTSPAMSKDAYTIAKNDAQARYKADMQGCASLGGNAKDICATEARGKEKVAGADAEEAYESTPRTRENARIARAQASYDVAVAKCDDLSGNRKDACVKAAKAEFAHAKADAKVDRVAADTRTDANNNQPAPGVWDSVRHANGSASDFSGNPRGLY